MGKKSSKAPKPDPNIGKAALMQAQTGQEWLAFSRDAFAVSLERQKELDALTKRVTESQLGIAEEQAGWARSDRKRYEEKFRPIEDQFIDEALNYGTPERQAEAAAEARADVQSASAGARAAAQREMASLGITPGSGRWAGIDRAAEMGTALADAGAANTARQQVRDKALALKADVANMGRGLPAQSAQATSLGINASNSAVGNAQGTNAQYIASTGIMDRGFAGQMQGYAGMGSTLNTQYGNQIAAYQAQNQANAAGASGIGSFLGGVTGLIFSDENLKTDKKELPEGTALSMVKEMPVEQWTYKQGVADEGTHVGPYAQDFQEATGKGDGRTIALQDAVGITMKAVQDLSAKVDKIGDVVGIGGAGTPAPKKRKPAYDDGVVGIAA